MASYDTSKYILPQNILYTIVSTKNINGYFYDFLCLFYLQLIYYIYIYIYIYIIYVCMYVCMYVGR